MDLGKSLNPAIDIGQVEGGFVQGMGWTCIEELVWGDAQHPWVRPGTLHTRGPGAVLPAVASLVALNVHPGVGKVYWLRCPG
jgi:xanthine dehydrogenase/oxidase